MSDWQYENLLSWTIKWNVSDQETHCRGIVTINYLFISIFRTLSLTYCALLSLASTTLAHYSLRSQTRLSQPPIDWSLLLVNINTPQLKVAACSTWPARNSPVSVKCITWRKYCSFFSLHKNQCEKVRKKKTKVIAMKNWECECVSPYDLGIFAVGPTNGHRAHVERWISVQFLFFVCEIKFCSYFVPNLDDMNDVLIQRTGSHIDFSFRHIRLRLLYCCSDRFSERKKSEKTGNCRTKEMLFTVRTRTESNWSWTCANDHIQFSAWKNKRKLPRQMWFMLNLDAIKIRSCHFWSSAACIRTNTRDLHRTNKMPLWWRMHLQSCVGLCSSERSNASRKLRFSYGSLQYLNDF